MSKQNISNLLMALLRALFSKEPLSAEAKETLNCNSTLMELYALSKKHDLAHLLATALEQEQIIISNPDIADKLQKQRLTAVFRCEQLCHEQEILFDALENAKIPFLPLKGAILRSYYPSPWMRTSCDIDVLVKEEDLNQAVSMLEQTLQYKNMGKGMHDVSLFSKNGVHIELHYNLNSFDGRKMESLDRVWTFAIQSQDNKYHYILPFSFFYFYHIAHMANHVLFGGCGIRSFLDIWMMERSCLDFSSSESLLSENHLLFFENTVRDLTSVWFETKSHTKLTSDFEQYILRGGIYGNLKNRVTAQSLRKKSRFNYILSRIFLSRKQLQSIYPVLEKKPSLAPFYQILRWFSFFSKSKRIRASHELMALRQHDAVTQKFLTDLGICSDNN